jgi:hypothetical protein
MPAQAFQQALGKLVTDESYRSVIEGEPQRLLSDCTLDPGELGVLLQVWERSGDTDVIAHMEDVDIYCCCSCCWPHRFATRRRARRP